MTPFIPMIILAKPVTTTSIPCIERSNTERVRLTSDLNRKERRKEMKTTHFANPGQKVGKVMESLRIGVLLTLSQRKALVGAVNLHA